MYNMFAGVNSHVVYPNGISCTLPEHLQEEVVHTIPGLEQAKLLYPGTYMCVGMHHKYSITYCVVCKYM